MNGRLLTAFVFALLLLTGWVCPPATRGEQPPLFPFALTAGAPENVTNVAAWLHRPAGRHGVVRVEGGRFVTDAGRIRFWATNLCFEACFPTREEAERLAARLARFGINCVRMHHMDARHIWEGSPDKLTINPQQLDRLDYLIYQLKQHGIYTNINLHVSRTLGPAEGFPNVEGRPRYDKGVGNFDPRMIEAQKKYARDLLTHVNPYTGTAYTEEPAVAMVEISNEDALFSSWNWGHFENLPDPYATTFQELWNAFLREKYGDTDALADAWNVGRRELGPQLLRGGDFAADAMDAWHLERDDQTKAELSREPSGGPEDRPRLRIAVEQGGRESWRPQLQQGGFSLTKGEAYTLEFFARASDARPMSVNCMMAHDPWQNLGLYTQVDLAPQWKPFRVTFVAQQDDKNARITFTGLRPGTYELAGVSLRSGGIAGLPQGQSLEDDSVAVLERRGREYTPAAIADWVDFLYHTEEQYWLGMYEFLKHELKVKAPVSGTQLSYGPATIQARLDYIDAHSYWKHPSFPGRPWDPRNWFVENAAMVAHAPGTLGSLAARRIDGLPYTVSEYNHPAPIQYAAEGFPMIAAFAGFQDWDGVFSFAWSHNRDFEPRRITSFFDIKGDPSRLVHLPACAAMFLREDVAAARDALLAPLSVEDERRLLRERRDPWAVSALSLGVASQRVVERRVAMTLAAEAASAAGQTAPSPPGLLVADTQQIRWQTQPPSAAAMIVDAPRSKLFTGFIEGDRALHRLGETALALYPNRLNWATVSMTVIEGEGFAGPGRVLIAATGLVQNTGMELERLEGNRITVRDRWGDEPALCEGIRADVFFPVPPARVRLFPLDESGDRRASVPVQPSGQGTVVSLGPQHRTLWYEVEIAPAD